MPLHEYKALLPHQEGIVPIVPHEAYACFFVPNTNSTKWYYAITVEPVYPKQKLGIVLTSDNELKAVKAQEIKKSVDRLKAVKSHLDQSPYVRQFDDILRKKLLELYMAHKRTLTGIL